MKSISKILFSITLCLTLSVGMTSSLCAQAKPAESAVVVSKKGEQVITMRVPGVCDMCKERIESAAMDVAGVKKAEWDIKTDLLVVVGSAKLNKVKVSEALAKAGYGSDDVPADPKAYSKLPTCCQYDSGLEKH